jgi:pimeloyl-ACP methyl ester carboxylesterase
MGTEDHMDLHMQRWGDQGPQILFVHGSVTNGEMTWKEQRPLADRWRLVVVDRRGYFPNPPIDHEDFEVDAADIAAILGGGMHLVGHSYGGVVALLAAAARPEAVWSLTVIEPPALAVAPRTAEIQAFSERIRRHWTQGPSDPDAFLRDFLTLAGSSAKPPSPLPPPLLQSAKLLMVERSPAEAVIPLDRLRGAPFPKLVVSGAHSAVFDQICDALETGLGAERAVVPGAGHSVPGVGARFNDRLEAFLREAEAARVAA